MPVTLIKFLVKVSNCLKSISSCSGVFFDVVKNSFPELINGSFSYINLAYVANTQGT